MKSIQENLNTPVTDTTDVLVAGGGVAGIAAALAAARQGKRVILLERAFVLGGLATAGLITIYLPLCDGCGRQVSFGLAEELLKLSIKEYCDGKLGVSNWLEGSEKTIQERAKGIRYEVNLNPHLFAISAEQELKAAGVEILYGTIAVDVKKAGDRITHVIVENKSGRSAIEVGNVVDASGDCDIARFANIPTALSEEGNKLAAWYYYHGAEGYDLKMIGMVDIPDDEEAKQVKTLGDRRFTGVDGREISRFMELSHAALLNDVREKRANDPTYQPVNIPSIPQLRMTRRLMGAYALDEKEVHTPFADSIGMVSDWRKRGPVWEVPYRTLYSPDCANLLTAGRCTSVTEDMWDVMRVIPCCAVTGEAAGTAAAIYTDVRTADISALQTALQNNGVVLHESELPTLK